MHSQRKPKSKQSYEVVNDREDRDDEADAQAAMHVIEVAQLGVDTEARWVKKSGQSVFGYKQHTVVDNNGLVIAIQTTAANCHDSKPLLTLLDKAGGIKTRHPRSCRQSLLQPKTSRCFEVTRP